MNAHWTIVKKLYSLFLILLIVASAGHAFVEGKEIGEKQGGTGIAKGESGSNFTAPDPLYVGSSPKLLMTHLQKFLSGSSWIVTSDQSRILFEDTVFTPPQDGSQILQAPGSALVPFRSPTPAFSRNILVTRDLGRIPFQTEPHLAVNPTDPDHLILGVIDYNFPSVNNYVSIDGGESWDGPYLTKYLKGDTGSGGDPVVGFDRQGNAYIAYISIGYEEYRVGPFVGSSYVSSIAVSSSRDGGRTWLDPISSHRSLVTLKGGYNEGFFEGHITLGFLDKPWIAIGPSSSDPDVDVIYVTYTKFESTYEIEYMDVLPIFVNPEIVTTIELVKSHDGGKTWSEPVKISPSVKRTSGGIGGKRVVQGSQPAVSPDGMVYVAWMDSTEDDSFEGLGEIHVARSSDEGRTFPIKQVAALIQEPGYKARTNNFRSWGTVFPQMTVGPTGEVYVVYGEVPTDKVSDDGDIYFIRSLDKGISWTNPVRLNDDETDRFQFFPSIDAGPDGIIHVMWGDFRDDPNEAAYHIYYTSSEDKGENWGFELEDVGLRFGSVRVTDFPSNPNFGFPRGQFIGDYFSIKSTKDNVYMVWADSRLGEFGPLNQKIGFARNGAFSSPSIFISPPSGSGGAEITIQGFNFQPEQKFFVQLEDAIISSGRTNNEGRFTRRLFIPISSEGAHNLVVFDESGNFATSSFYTDFGFDTVKKQLEGTSSNIVEKIDSLEEKISNQSKNGSLPIQGIDINELKIMMSNALELSLEEKQSGTILSNIRELVVLIWMSTIIAVLAIIMATISIIFRWKKK